MNKYTKPQTGITIKEIGQRAKEETIPLVFQLLLCPSFWIGGAGVIFSLLMFYFLTAVLFCAIPSFVWSIFHS